MVEQQAFVPVMPMTTSIASNHPRRLPAQVTQSAQAAQRRCTWVKSCASLCLMLCLLSSSLPSVALAQIKRPPICHDPDPPPFVGPPDFHLVVKEVWSNQIADVEVNGFPDKTGRNNQSYSIMGVRADGNAYIRIKLEYPIPFNFRKKILFRLRQPQIPTAGVSVFSTEGDVVDVIAKNVSDNPQISHRLYYGYDGDEDGELSEIETLECVYSTANGKDRIPVEFKIISKTRHEQSRLKNIDFATNAFAGTISYLAPNGASLIKSFHNAAPPESDSIRPIMIDRTGNNRLSHPVGVAFNPKQLPGEALNGIYNYNHLIAENILKSTPFRRALRDAFDRVLPILYKHMITTGASDGFLTLSWEEAVRDQSLNFRLNQNTTPSMPDFDSFLALGKVRVENSRIGFEYDLSAQYVSVYFQGSFTDLYDFDYDDCFSYLAWSIEEIRRGAETQAGYPTLANGGKVFNIQVNIRDDEDEYINTGYNFFMYK